MAFEIPWDWVVFYRARKPSQPKYSPHLRTTCVSAGNLPLWATGAVQRDNPRTGRQALDKLVTKLMRYFTSAEAAHKERDIATEDKQHAGV